MREYKTRYWVALIIFVVLSIMVIPMVSSQAIPSPAVEIKNPGNRVTVEGYIITVEGTSSGLEDPDLHLYILVHPIAADLWWVQSLPTSDRDGSWVSRVYLGTSELGNNEDYAIKAIITTERLNGGDTIKVNQLPFFVADDLVIVKREDKTIVSFIFSSIGLAVIGIIIAIIFGFLGIRQWKRMR